MPSYSFKKKKYCMAFSEYKKTLKIIKSCPILVSSASLMSSSDGFTCPKPTIPDLLFSKNECSYRKVVSFNTQAFSDCL